MWKLNLRLPKTRSGAFNLLAFVVAIVFILASSAYVYAASSDFFDVFPAPGDSPDPNLDVDLRIDKINTNPSKVVALVTAKMKNKSPSPIFVKEFTVKAYDRPPGPLHYVKFGEDSRVNISLPAGSTSLIKLNVKIENYTYLKEILKKTCIPGRPDTCPRVYVQAHIVWTHNGQTNDRWYPKYIDLTPWKFLLGYLP